MLELMQVSEAKIQFSVPQDLQILKTKFPFYVGFGDRNAYFWTLTVKVIYNKCCKVYKNALSPTWPGFGLP